MILKLKNKASEGQYDLSNGKCIVNPFVKSFLDKKFTALKKGMLITDDLIAEAEHFIARNKMINEDEGSYCPDCLKAHIIKKAKEKGLVEDTISYLNDSFPGEKGHNGYYLDEDMLKKV